MNNTNNISALLTNARTAFQKNDLSRAYELYLQVINLSPTNTVALLETGQLCVAIGKHNDAANIFQQAIELEPNNISGHYMMGSLHLI